LHPARPRGKITQGDDALEVMGVLTDHASNVTPFVVNQLLKIFMKDFAGVCGTHGEIFGDTTTRGKAGSTALGFPSDECARPQTSRCVRTSHPRSPASSRSATQGLGRHAGIHAARAANLRPRARRAMVEQHARLLRARLARLGRRRNPYTFHWGKIHALDGPRVRRMYTDAAVDSWLTARKTLLDTPKLRKVFSNQWLRDLGMDA